MNATSTFATKVEAIVERDARYEKEAYAFVRDALEFTTRQSKKPADIYVEQHVSGQQLLDGVRRYALEQFGPMVPTVFEHWGIMRCEDIGAIVFNLIEAREFGKAETDTLDDFSGGYDFQEAFVDPFRSVVAKGVEAEETRRPRARPVREES